jgi:hypothetical protein
MLPVTSGNLDFLLITLMPNQIDLQPFLALGRPFTAALAAWLLAFYSDEAMWEPHLRENLVNALSAACNAQQLFSPSQPSGRKDPRMQQIIALEKKDSVSIYTDYNVAQHVDAIDEKLRLTVNKEEADFLLISTHVKDFMSLPIYQRVCQFPFEGALVRKVSCRCRVSSGDFQ